MRVTAKAVRGVSGLVDAFFAAALRAFLIGVLALPSAGAARALGAAEVLDAAALRSAFLAAAVPAEFFLTAFLAGAALLAGPVLPADLFAVDLVALEALVAVVASDVFFVPVPLPCVAIRPPTDRFAGASLLREGATFVFAAVFTATGFAGALAAVRVAALALCFAAFLRVAIVVPRALGDEHFDSTHDIHAQ